MATGPTEEWRRPRRRERQVRPVGRSSVGDHARVAGPRASLTHCGGSCTHTTAASALGLRCPASPPPGLAAWTLPPLRRGATRPRRLCRCILACSPLPLLRHPSPVTSWPMGPGRVMVTASYLPLPSPPHDRTSACQHTFPHVPSPHHLLRLQTCSHFVPSFLPAENGVGHCSAGAGSGVDQRLIFRP